MNADEMIAHARAVRARLRHPPNAVADRRRPLDHTVRIEPAASPHEALAVTARFVTEKFNISLKDLSTRGKFHPTPLARHFLSYLATKYLGFSLHGVGNYLQQDHTTILNGRNRIVRRLMHAGKGDPLLKLEEEYREVYVPAFALPNLGKPHLEGLRAPRLSQQGIHGVEG